VQRTRAIRAYNCKGKDEGVEKSETKVAGLTWGSMKTGAREQWKNLVDGLCSTSGMIVVSASHNWM